MMTTSPNIIAIVNTKGGPGKTTTAYNLAEELSRSHRILLIDFDSQANLTEYYIEDSVPEKSTVYNLVTEEDHSPLKTSNPNLDIYCACERQKTLETSNDHFLVHSIKNALLAASSGYDITIIDTPGFDGNRVFYSMATANYILVPLELDRFNLSALAATIKKLRVVKQQVNPRLSLLGIVPSKVNGLINGVPRVAKEKQWHAYLQEKMGDLIWPIVERRASIRKSQELSCPVADVRPIDHEAINVIKQLAQKTRQKLGLGASHER